MHVAWVCVLAVFHQPEWTSSDGRETRDPLRDVSRYLEADGDGGQKENDKKKFDE